MRREIPDTKASRQRGFTLLEIIVSIAIASILVTMFAVRFATESKGEALQQPAMEIRKMARAANRNASAYRDEYRITFFKDGFFLSRVPIFERFQADEASIDQFLLGEGSGINLEVRRFGNPKWIRPNGTAWVFQPTGLSEPISVKLSNEDGFMEMTFNPMTATVDDERFIFE